MVAPPTVLIIDLGTSGPKVSVFDFELRLIASAFREVPLVFDGERGVEQRPSDWILGIEAAIDAIACDHRDALARVKVMNVTSQWSGTVALSRSGEPLMNAINWMDSRGAPDAARLTDGLIKVDGYGLIPTLQWIRITGGAPTRSGKDPISHILFLKRERPAIYEKTSVFLEPKDYLNFHLTGRAAASFDSITLHWLTDNREIGNIRYSTELISKSGIDPEKLPELVPVNSILGTVRAEVASRFGIPADAVVVSGTPDLHSGAVGSGGVRDFDPHLYIGTSAWIICHVPFKKADLFHNIASIPSGIPGRYLMVNEQQTAGASLQFLKNRILFPANGVSRERAPEDAYSRMDALAETVPAGSEGLYYFPWLNGERSPSDASHLRGGFVNLSLRHEQKHLIRAVMEGVALNLRWLKEHTESFCGRDFESIRFIGGGARSSVWGRILADTLGIPIEQMKDPLTANSKGAAALALVATGEMSMEEIGSRIEVARVFEPGADQAVYERKFGAYLDYLKRNESWFREQNAGS